MVLSNQKLTETPSVKPLHYPTIQSLIQLPWKEKLMSVV